MSNDIGRLTINRKAGERVFVEVNGDSLVVEVVEFKRRGVVTLRFIAPKSMVINREERLPDHAEG